MFRSNREVLWLHLKKQKRREKGQCIVVTVYNITQQLAVLLAIPCVRCVNRLGQVPVFHYWIIGQHSGPSPSPLLLPRERWKPYWSCVWISDQSAQISPQGGGRETGDKGYFYDCVFINHNSCGERCGRNHKRFSRRARAGEQVGAAEERVRGQSGGTRRKAAPPRLSRWTSVARDPAVASCNWVK